MYANLTIQLYRTVDAGFFRVWGAAYALATLALWAAVFLRTVTLVHHGVIFESPCLEDFDMACAGGPRKRQTEAEMETEVGKGRGASGACGVGGAVAA